MQQRISGTNPLVIGQRDLEQGGGGPIDSLDPGFVVKIRDGNDDPKNES